MKKQLLSLMFIAVLLVTTGAALAGLKHYLEREYIEKGDRMCVYDNGTVLNIGYKVCPLYIED